MLGLLSLEWINLDHNPITDISLPYLPSISTMYLSYNQLANLDGGSLLGLRNVHTLMVTSNALAGVLDVSNLTAIHVLQANTNNISDLNVLVHNQLHTIILTDNFIQYFPPHIDNSSLPALEILRINRNNIRGNISVPYLQSLLELNLDDNGITGITFVDDSPLESLFLSRNDFHRLPDLSNISETLTALRIDYNSISAIDKAALSSLIHLEEFYIRGKWVFPISIIKQEHKSNQDQARPEHSSSYNTKDICVIFLYCRQFSCW